ncbi:hypothetical protein [Pseudomonas akapageensis]|uniref:hypothetical protein n=1 Tax=Pseudomonas akapageensis TaxID=2609961 RepID=UPI001409D58E|nr:hypothetical protein [Pseudomonas akapageensis]
MEKKPKMKANNATREAGALLDPPIVKVLADIEGGEPNLVHRDDLSPNLRVEIPMWPNSNPSDSYPEHLTLYRDNALVETKTWTAPVPDDERFFLVPPIDGRQVLRYHVLGFNGEGSDSESLTITIDLVAPVLGGEEGLLDFDDEVDRDGVTARYLELHDDLLLATAPTYNRPEPGDKITWCWDRQPFANEYVDETVLTLADMNQPLVIGFTGDMIRDRGDGQRYAHYQIEDRAGNKSTRSRPVTLPVAAAPVPRVLPWPDVELAAGTGEEIVLDPWEARNGVVVIVPQAAVIHPGEGVTVQWAEPGSTGAHRTTQETGARRYAIPADKIAAHIGKTIPVYYEVTAGQANLPSDRRRLRMGQMAANRFPNAQCNGLSGGNLRLSTVEDSGARLTVVRWVLMTTDHRVTIKVTGISGQNVPMEHTALREHRVTTAELTSGIGGQGTVLVPKSFLSQLKRNQQFQVTVTVSFDNGATWPPVPNFPSLYLILVD